MSLLGRWYWNLAEISVLHLQVDAVQLAQQLRKRFINQVSGALYFVEKNYLLSSICTGCSAMHVAYYLALFCSD